MTEEKVPYSWVGQAVDASIVHGWAKEHPSRTLTAWRHTLDLIEVNELGILGTTRQAQEQKPRFYPWAAVLSMALYDEEDETKPKRRRPGFTS